MLGAASLSEVPLSTEAGSSVAAFAMVGAGQLAANGAASASAVFASSGAGSFVATGASTGRAAFSLNGSGSLTAIGVSSVTTAFAIVGAASFTAYGEPIYGTPLYRTAVVPRISRVLVLAARHRSPDVPAYARVATVLASPPRTLMVPALGNLIEAG